MRAADTGAGIQDDTERGPNGVVINTRKWEPATRRLAERCPVFVAEDGKPDATTILTAAADCGFSEINDDNLGTVGHALIQHAAALAAS